MECLAGASIDEVTADYAKSFINYYGVETGSRKYKVIVNNIKDILRVAFKTSQIDTVDLSACARAYLLSTGLSDETLDKVIENLGKPWTD